MYNNYYLNFSIHLNSSNYYSKSLQDYLKYFIDKILIIFALSVLNNNDLRLES